MNYEPSRTGEGPQMISLKQHYEVREWCDSLGHTEGELRAAVKAAGNCVDRVREYLGRTYMESKRRPVYLIRQQYEVED